MSKKKKKNPKTRRQHSGSQKQNQQAQQRMQREQRERNAREEQRDLPNTGANRQQKRDQIRNPHGHRSSKPTWLRVLIIVVLIAILCGFVLVPVLSMR